MKIAFVFSGQGAQTQGMMKDIYDNSHSAKRIMDLAESSLGRSIADICFYGTQEELNLTYNTQPCVLAADLAAAYALIEKGLKPDGVAGFSLGEYAAMVVAGVIPEVDVYSLVQKRADYMQECVPIGSGGMVAVNGLEPSAVEKICNEISGGYALPANYNAPTQIVVSGDQQGINEVIEIAEANGGKCVRLQVSAPFHCGMLKGAADKLKTDLSGINFQNPNIPVYLNYTADVLKSKNDVAENLFLQAFNPVRWTQTIEKMYSDGYDTFIECGPGKTLSGLVRRILKGRDVSIYKINSSNDIDKLFVDGGYTSC